MPGKRKKSGKLLPSSPPLSLWGSLPARQSNSLSISLLLLLCFGPALVPAPVPRCSPFIIINKLVESNNLFSDSNPYFPVPPCEHGGPVGALKARDLESVFVLAHPERVPLHTLYELFWLIKTGAARLGRMLLGKQQFYVDTDILKEGYRHHTPYVRTRKLGYDKHRDTRPINNFTLWKKLVGGKLRTFKTQGFDQFDPKAVHEFKGSYQGPPNRLINAAAQLKSRSNLPQMKGWKYESGFVPVRNPVAKDETVLSK